MKAFKEYVKFWPLIVGIVAIISSWAGMSYMIKIHDEKIKEINERIEDLPVIRKELERLSARLDRRERRPN